MDNNEVDARPSGIVVFRASESAEDDGLPIMTHEPPKEVEVEGAQKLIEAGVESGHENRVIFAGAGFSLVYAWFKSGYPLPRHSHNSDCLYYILAGSLKLGNDELFKGDGFLLRSGVPYTYTVGSSGLEILEFRASELFNIELFANNPAFWNRAVKTVEENRERWLDEVKPSTVS